MNPSSRIFAAHRRGMARRVAAIVLALGPAAGLGLAVPAAGAATGTVTNCAASGTGSLPDAVANANSGDTITFALSCSTITLTTTLSIGTDVTITGPGAGALAVSGGGSVQVVSVPAGVTASISGLTVEDGTTATGTAGTPGVDSSGADDDPGTSGGPGGNSGDGGGIDNAGNLTLSGVVVTGNTTGAGGGGGVGGAGFLVPESLNSGSGGAGGNAGNGGGIENTGTLTMTDSTVTGNSTGSGGAGGAGGSGAYGADPTGSGGPGGNAGRGGGIDNSGTLDVSDTTVSGNTTGSGGPGGAGGSADCCVSTGGGAGGNGGDGGGIASAASSAVVQLTSSLVSDNVTGGGGTGGAGGDDPSDQAGSGGNGGRGGDGGGLANGGAATLVDDTLPGNGAQGGGVGGGAGFGGSGGDSFPVAGTAGRGGQGGAISNTGTVQLTSSTLSDNEAAGDGGAIYGGAGMTVSGSILSGTTTPGTANTPDNCAGGAPTDGGYNVEDALSCGFAAGNGSLTGLTDAAVGLGALAANGGPTQTEAVGVSSAAYHLVPTTSGICQSTDQRGVTRPQPTGSPDCDAGAYELTAPTPPGPPVLLGPPVRGDGSATLAFAPSSSGSSPVQSYTVTATDLTNAANGGEAASGTSSPITVPGLTNGDTYTLAVTATSADGTGAPSIASADVIPATVPDAPSIGPATPGDNSASVSFTPPDFDGGTPVTGYTVTATDLTTPGNGGQTASRGSSPISVYGLTNGDQYSFTVTATNAVGTGAASGASNTVVPSTGLVSNCNASGAGSLAAAVAGADAASGQVIDFALSCPVIVDTQTLAITADMSIDGPGAGALAVSGDGTVGVFSVASDVTASISGLTIEDGASAPSAPGGGIDNAGTLTVTDAVVTGNQAGAGAAVGGYGTPGNPGGSGGGIANSGALFLRDSTVSDNATGAGSSGSSGTTITQGGTSGGTGGSGGNGGGVANSGYLSVTSSTIVGNTTGGGGAGGTGGVGSLMPGAGGPNPGQPITISLPGGPGGTGGSAGNGGGIANSGYLFAANDTISDNAAGLGGAGGGPGVNGDGTTTQPSGAAGSAGQGGGVFSSGGITALSGTVLAGTTAPGTGNTPNNCAGTPVTDDGYNVEDSTSCAFNAAAGSLSGQTDSAVGLSPLGAAGGPTPTEAIDPTSVAVHLVPVASGLCPTTDQRGVARPQGAGAVACDAGAYEGAVPGAPLIGTATPGNASASVTFAASTTGDAPVNTFTVTANDLTNPQRGGQRATGAASPLTVNGLTIGDSYSFTVTASNAFGTGPASGTSNAVVPSLPPMVSSISPNSGPKVGGTVVTITGSGFVSGATAVHFGNLTGASVYLLGPDQLTVVSPAVPHAHQVNITVTTPDGTSNVVAVDHFTYLPLPTVTGISPNSGPKAGGTTVTVSGTGFTGATAVHFGNLTGTSVDVVDPDQLTVVSPAVPHAHRVNITVTTPDGTSNVVAVDHFAYLPPAAVTEVSPASGHKSGEERSR